MDLGGRFNASHGGGRRCPVWPPGGAVEVGRFIGMTSERVDALAPFL